MLIQYFAVCAPVCLLTSWCVTEPAPATVAPTPTESAFVIGVDRFYQQAESGSPTGGMLLLTELSCTACHTSPTDELVPKRGPKLDAAGRRLQPEWIRRFLSDPAKTKPGTTMPHVLHRLSPETRKSTIDAMVAFLASQRQPFRQLNSTAGNPIAFEFWRKGNVLQGRKLFHEVGCVACHAPATDYASAPKEASPLDKLLARLNADDIKELGLEHVARPVRSIPLGDLAAKYTRIALTHFLLEPEVVRPAGRMPNLKLHPTEAADVAAYLLQSQTGAVGSIRPVQDSKLIAKGRELFGKLKCGQCHDSDEKGDGSISRAVVRSKVKPLVKLDTSAQHSCLESADQKQPLYALNAIQTTLIRQAINVLNSSGPPVATDAETRDRLDFRMLQLNCYGCHERNKRGGVGPKRRPYFETVGHVDIGDEGRLPPPLDQVGRKLTTKWLATVFKGDGAVRPHMMARMPKFPATVVKSLPQRFAKVDGFSATPAAKVFGDTTRLAEAGRQLFDTGCVQCHPVRGDHLPGVVGIDLASIRDRVHPQWLRDFLLNPSALKPRTRMPTFFPKGRSANPAVLNGNVDRQLAAMWAYLKDIDKHPLPEKILIGKEHNFELKPKDRPLIVRTFMREVGTHSIAVGFKERVHFAFDADRIRLAQVWRGRFIDAHGTWFNRFQPPIVPLGVNVIGVSPGVPLAILSDPLTQWPGRDNELHRYRFGGFRIDKSGVPTFLYQFGPFKVEDRLAPAKSQSLERRLRIERKPETKTSTVWFRAHTGKTLQPQGVKSYRNGAGLRVTVRQEAGHAGELRRSAKLTEWIIPIKTNQTATLTVTYDW